ncbi:MAG: sugar transferase [Opitutales bacterium]|nr:sugar transferase [Opitutales bacterium]
MWKNCFKRFFDFCAALFALFVLSPFFLFISLWLLVVNRGSGIFFVQERPGRNEKIFKLYKFKSMKDLRDGNGDLLPDALRLTSVGRFLRATSLDELPQFWNVLKGDMSLVGPRPLLKRYLPAYRPRERLRHSVRPGITGWAQVNGRNCISWDEKLALDVDYVEHCSFCLDLKIILLTVFKVLKRSDVEVDSQEGFLDESRGCSH